MISGLSRLFFYFYPRPPRGGRLHIQAGRGQAPYFYPRPPRGGRPEGIVPLDVGQDISIHALREEGDASSAASFPSDGHFYPRPPRGGRRLTRFPTSRA